MPFQTNHDVSMMLDRERGSRNASPSGGLLRCQTVQAPHAKTRGHDANKRIVGRKRHIAVDTDGRLLTVNLMAAEIADSAGTQTIIDAIRKGWPRLKHLFPDGAYDCPLLVHQTTMHAPAVNHKRFSRESYFVNKSQLYQHFMPTQLSA